MFSLTTKHAKQLNNSELDFWSEWFPRRQEKVAINSEIAVELIWGYVPGTTCSTGLACLVLLPAQPSNMLHSCGSIERPLRSMQTMYQKKNIHMQLCDYLNYIYVHILYHMILYYINTSRIVIPVHMPIMSLLIFQDAQMPEPVEEDMHSSYLERWNVTSHGDKSLSANG